MSNALTKNARQIVDAIADKESSESNIHFPPFDSMESLKFSKYCEKLYIILTTNEYKGITKNTITKLSNVNLSCKVYIGIAFSELMDESVALYQENDNIYKKHQTND